MSEPKAENTRLLTQGMSTARKGSEVTPTASTTDSFSSQKGVRLPDPTDGSRPGPRTVVDYESIFRPFQATVVLLQHADHDVELDFEQEDSVSRLCAVSRPIATAFEDLPLTVDAQVAESTKTPIRYTSKIPAGSTPMMTPRALEDPKIALPAHLQTTTYTIRRLVQPHTYELKLYVTPLKRVDHVLSTVLPRKAELLLDSILQNTLTKADLDWVDTTSDRHKIFQIGSPEERELHIKIQFIQALAQANFLTAVYLADRIKALSTPSVRAVNKVLSYYKKFAPSVQLPLGHAIRASRTLLTITNIDAHREPLEVVTSRHPEAPPHAISPQCATAVCTVDTCEYRGPQSSVPIPPLCCDTAFEVKPAGTTIPQLSPPQMELATVTASSPKSSCGPHQGQPWCLPTSSPPPQHPNNRSCSSLLCPPSSSRPSTPTLNQLAPLTRPPPKPPPDTTGRTGYPPQR